MATPNLGLTKPTVGGSSGTWGSTANTNYDLLDLHDHSSGKGVAIPSAGININANLTFAGFQATNVGAVDFSGVAALAAGGGILYQDSGDNELYWRTAGGTNVKLTSGTSLNVAAFVGGIGGDYASVSALLDFDDASDSYRLRQQVGAAVRQFAKTSTSDLSLFEFKAVGVSPVPTNAVTLKSPAALGASYSVTLPGAVPGANGTLAQFTTAGVMSFSNSGLAAITMASNAGITTSGSGSLTIGGTGTITSAGLITATAGVTAAANQHFTTSGTGDFKHGDKTLIIPAAAANGFTSVSYQGERWDMTSSSSQVWFPIPLRIGKRIKQIVCWYVRSAGTTTFTLTRVTNSTAAFTTVASTTIASGTTLTSITLSSINHTILSTDQYVFRYVPGSGVTTDQVYSIELTYDNP